MMDAIKNRTVWWLNLELLPRNPHGKRGVTKEVEAKQKTKTNESFDGLTKSFFLSQFLRANDVRYSDFPLLNNISLRMKIAHCQKTLSYPHKASSNFSKLYPSTAGFTRKSSWKQ